MQLALRPLMKAEWQPLIDQVIQRSSMAEGDDTEIWETHTHQVGD
jgi:hypothetical protein